MQVELTCGKNLPSSVSKAEPKHRREQRKAGACTRTVFENGAPVATEVVAAKPAAAAPKAPRQERPANYDAATARSTQNGVLVHFENGANEEFTSTRKAFAALGLPDNKHVKFRAELKRAGAMAFEHGGKTYNFVVLA